MGNRSVPIVVLTALFAGGLMALQTAPFVKQFGATALAGWGAGYAVLREIGPILIALMFSGFAFVGKQPRRRPQPSSQSRVRYSQKARPA